MHPSITSMRAAAVSEVQGAAVLDSASPPPPSPLVRCCMRCDGSGAQSMIYVPVLYLVLIVISHIVHADEFILHSIFTLCSHLEGRQLKGQDGADAQHHRQAGRGIELQDLPQCGTVSAGLSAQPATGGKQGEGQQVSAERCPQASRRSLRQQQGGETASECSASTI